MEVPEVLLLIQPATQGVVAWVVRCRREVLAEAAVVLGPATTADMVDMAVVAVLAAGPSGAMAGLAVERLAVLQASEAPGLAEALQGPDELPAVGEGLGPAVRFSSDWVQVSSSLMGPSA